MAGLWPIAKDHPIPMRSQPIDVRGRRLSRTTSRRRRTRCTRARPNPPGVATTAPITKKVPRARRPGQPIERSRAIVIAVLSLERSQTDALTGRTTSSAVARREARRVLEVDLVTQLASEGVDDLLPVIARPVEAAVDGALGPAAKRLEEGGHDERRGGDGHRVVAGEWGKDGLQPEHDARRRPGRA